MPDVVIVGGGIIGAACAWDLARRGVSVTLLERAELAAGASGRNQGLLGPPDDPVNSPLYQPSLRFYREAADRAPLPIWIDEEPLTHLLVTLGSDEVEEPTGAIELGPAELRELEPELTPSAERGWLGEGWTRLDPRALTIGLALCAAESGGSIRHHLPARALSIDGDRVTGVVTDEGSLEAEVVVMAAGPWSGPLLEPLGVRLPLGAARGWIVRLGDPPASLRHLVERAGWRASERKANAASTPTGGAFVNEGVSAVGGALLNPHPSGDVLVGWSREPVVGPEPADPDVTRRQVADAIELVPSLAEARVRSAWWGLRPMTPDERPMIGRVRDGLVIATGHGSEGVFLGGGTALLVTSIALGEPPPFDPAPFDPFRF
jgi:glycine/D-amino acid oxidase-like deaminating enzyme